MLADTIGFDQDAAGALPAGWTCGVTGSGSPKWAVEADSTAPSKPNVLKQSGSVDFEGKRIRVSLNGQQFIDLEDDHISGAGAVGVWTKADSVTEFDDFSHPHRGGWI